MILDTHPPALPRAFERKVFPLRAAGALALAAAIAGGGAPAVAQETEIKYTEISSGTKEMDLG